MTKFRNHLVFRQHLNKPLFIPKEGRFVLQYLEDEGLRRMEQELEKLSKLGSAWAAAVLGCICLVHQAEGCPDSDRAIALCESHAKAGDPYALFVYAWALKHKGQRVAAVRAMEKAAKLGFPPATLDFVTFVWRGWGVTERSPRVARLLLRKAFRAHHASAMGWLAGMYRSGQFGRMRWMLSWLMVPVAAIWQSCAMIRDPFSCRVFSLTTAWRSPIFRTPE